MPVILPTPWAIILAMSSGRGRGQIFFLGYLKQKWSQILKKIPEHKSIDYSMSYDARNIYNIPK